MNFCPHRIKIWIHFGGKKIMNLLPSLYLFAHHKVWLYEQIRLNYWELADSGSVAGLLSVIWWVRAQILTGGHLVLLLIQPLTLWLGPNTPRSLLLTGLAGEYYWMSIWPHYMCVATGNQLSEGGGGEGGGAQLHHGMETWPLFFFPLPFSFSSLREATRLLPCTDTCTHSHAHFAKSRRGTI